MLFDDRRVVVLVLLVGLAGDRSSGAADDRANSGADAGHHTADHRSCNSTRSGSADLFTVIVAVLGDDRFLAYHSLVVHGWTSPVRGIGHSSGPLGGTVLRATGG